MLPTNNKATAPIFKSNNHLYIGYGEKLEYNNRDNSYQHLYITSDEEIKEGDWCIQNGNYLCKITCNQDRTQQGLKKIIATTDKSIAIQHDTLSIPQRKGLINHYPTEKVILPTVSNGFIKKFIERYNAGNPITEVMVEHEYESGYQTIDPILEMNPILKVDKNNCITIKAVKESWTREELDEVLNRFAVDAMTAALHGLLPSDAKHFTNHWTKENL